MGRAPNRGQYMGGNEEVYLRWHRLSHSDPRFCLSFLEAIDRHLRHEQYSIAQLMEKYRVLEELLSRLIQTDGPLSSELLDLMRLAGRVRRPFHGRAVTIVRMWQFLNANSDVRADRDITRRSELQRHALNTTARRCL